MVAGAGAWQAPSSNTFNSGPALNTAAATDDWEDPWSNSTPQPPPQQQQPDWNADVSSSRDLQPNIPML